MRHRNLLKIMSACSSIDHEGNNFKSLIFEFMCNGYLEQWLHPKNGVQHQSKRLSFIQRLNIALGVACLLEYLHHLCQTQIVHCVLKPNNILLDEDIVAHVSDFGLVKFLFEASKNPSQAQTLSIGLKCSIGYIPSGNFSTNWSTPHFLCNNLFIYLLLWEKCNFLFWESSKK